MEAAGAPATEHSGASGFGDATDTLPVNDPSQDSIIRHDVILRIECAKYHEARVISCLCSMLEHECTHSARLARGSLLSGLSDATASEIKLILQ